VEVVSVFFVLWYDVGLLVLLCCSTVIVYTRYCIAINVVLTL
jgi:hypothetical protein